MWLEGEEGAVNYQGREGWIPWGGDDAQAGRGWIVSPGRRRPTPEISPPFRPAEDLLRDKGFFLVFFRRVSDTCGFRYKIVSSSATGTGLSVRCCRTLCGVWKSLSLTIMT